MLVNFLAIDSKCTMHVSNVQFPAILGELIHFLILSNNAKKVCCLMVVRCVSVDTSPSCVLAIDKQLRDLQCFCTHPGNLCVLGIDSTFNLGKFYCIITSFTWRTKEPMCHLHSLVLYLCTQRRTSKCTIIFLPPC